MIQNINTTIHKQKNNKIPVKAVIPDKPYQYMHSNTKSKSDLSIYSIFYGFLVVSTILIYYILIPILNASCIQDKGIDLLKSYYVEHKYKSLIIDFLFVTMLLKISEKFPDHIPIVFIRILVIIVFDVLLGIYINKTPYVNGTIKFLKEWSISAGWLAIVWDVIYISLIGKVSDKIDDVKIIKKIKYN